MISLRLMRIRIFRRLRGQKEYVRLRSRGALPVRRLPLGARRSGARPRALPGRARPGRLVSRRRRGSLGPVRFGCWAASPALRRRPCRCGFPRGYRPRCLRRRVRLDGRRRAALVAAAPFRTLRLRRARRRARRLARTAVGGAPGPPPRADRPPARLAGASLALVAARTANRWRGEPNPVDSPPGRIPGAVNAPWAEPTPEVPRGEVVAY